MGLLGSRRNTVERLNSIRLNSAVLGTVRPIFFGQARLTARLIWYGDFSINKAKQQGGKGLGKGGVSYVYSASIIAALCEGPCFALLNLWDSTGRFVLISNSPNSGGGPTGGTGGGGGGGVGGPPSQSLGAAESFTIPGGGGNYTVAHAAIFGFDQGVARQDAFSVPVNDYGSPGLVTYSGTQNTPMKQVPSAPGAGQYSVNPATGVYTFSAADGGKTVQVSYSYYRYQIITQEKTIVPFSGPFTVTVDNSSNFKYDLGVVYYPSGTALTDVSPSAPAVGQYSRSGATYTFNSGDTGLGILINYVYQDPNTNTNAPTVLNVTLVGGTLGQAAQSYMTGRHPSQALGYSQLAYIFSSGLFLGYTPELPNYTYELAGPFQVGGGILDANPADCIASLLTNPQYGLGFPATSLGSLVLAQQCWTANSFFISPLIENPRSASSIVAEWLEAGMVGAFWSEALLKFVPYCDTTMINNGVTFSPSTTPVANLTYDNFLIEKKGEEPITIERSPWQDAWNKVRVSYNARINDYNPEVIEESDEAGIQRFGLRAEDAKTWDFVTTVAAAQYAASMRVQRAAYIRNKYTFRLPSSFAWLEPMDVVTIPFVDLSNTLPVRINKIEDDPEKGLAITAEDFIWGTAQPAFNPKAVNSPYLADLGQQDPGNTNALIIELPNRAPGNNFTGCKLIGFVNGSNPNWGGCHVWFSFDGTSYDTLKDGNGNALNVGRGRLGILTQILQAFGGANPDNTNTLQVKLNVPGDSLPAASSASAAQLVSLCALVNPNAENLFPQSAQFGTSPWITDSSGTTVVQDNATAPDGTVTADTVTAALANGDRYQTSSINSAIGDHTPYTFSVWLKVASGTQPVTLFVNRIGGDTEQVTVTATTSWQRFQFTHSTTWTGVGLIQAGIFIVNNGAAIQCWGAQFERYNPALGYVPTTTAARTNVNTVELVSYQNSALQGAELYNLTTLYRGAYNTTPAFHAPGEIFGRLDEASFTDVFDPTYINKTIFFKFTSFNLLGNQEQSLPNVPAYSVFISGSGTGAVALDTGYLLVGAPGYTAYRPLSNPLTGHDAGASATVNIASFTMQLAGLANLNYNSGSITGLSYNTLYYIYFDDIAELGGTVTYNATTTKETAFSGTNRFFIGSIQTPRAGAPDTAGNGDGGSGAQYGMLNILGMALSSATQIAGIGTITNVNKAVDGDQTTFASLNIPGNNTSNQINLILTGPPGITRKYFSAVLKVRFAIVNTSNNGVGANVRVQIAYNFNPPPVGGALSGSFTAIYTQLDNVGSVAVQTISATLPLGQNLSQLVVEAFVSHTAGVETSGSTELDVYEVWIEAIE